MIIGKNAFFLYRKNDKNFEIEYIDGNPYYQYILHEIKLYAEQVLTALVDINNLDDKNEIELIIIENSDHVRNVNVEQVLEKYIKERLKLDTVLLRIMHDLLEDKNLYIKDFGINYDGECYILENNILKRDNYSLLAYTINQDMLMKYV